MQVKIIKNLNISNGPIIPVGEICKVRIFATMPLQFNAPFQVIDGNYSGHFIPREYCIEHSNEKMFNADQVKSIEDYYKSLLDKERAAKGKATELAANVSKKVVEKDKEIEKLNFYLEASTIALEAAVLSFQRAKEKA